MNEVSLYFLRLEEEKVSGGTLQWVTAKFWKDWDPCASLRILSEGCRLCSVSCLPQVSLPSARAVTLCRKPTFELLRARASTAENLLGCFNLLTTQKTGWFFFPSWVSLVSGQWAELVYRRSSKGQIAQSTSGEKGIFLLQRVIKSASAASCNFSLALVEQSRYSRTCKWSIVFPVELL